MAFSFEKYSDEPIILNTLTSEFGGQHVEDNVEQLTALLDTAAEPCFYLIDARELKLSFDDLLIATNLPTRGANAVLHHPNLQETVVISGDKMVTLAVKGMRSAVFGHVNISVFPTPEEALGYIRGQLAST